MCLVSYKEAAHLGDAAAHYQLSLIYYSGRGVEENGEMELHHIEKAAFDGHPQLHTFLELTRI